MKKITVGILAHVDAGKTTLCESILFKTGVIRAQGRIENGSTCFDYKLLERQRGITVFAKEARVRWNECDINIIDTPGHTDFKSEAARVLPILDVIVFVVSATEINKPQNLYLFQNIEKCGIPIVIFISKADASSISSNNIISYITDIYSSKIIAHSHDGWDVDSASLLSESILEKAINGEPIETSDIVPFILSLNSIPCLLGSGLTGDGVEELLSLISFIAEGKKTEGNLEKPQAYIYKIDYDKKGIRQTHVKVLSGTYIQKASVSYETSKTESEKINEIRFLTGEKYISVPSAETGDICVFTGLYNTIPGELLGKQSPRSLDTGLLCFELISTSDTTHEKIIIALKQLEDEEPAYAFSCNNGNRILVHLNGEIQAEVLLSDLQNRFGISASLSDPIPEYRETISTTSYGNGHFEPLRHYAEVRLKISPLPSGSGLIFDSTCPENTLEKHWQSLILTQLRQSFVPGVLIGAPLTDLRITLVNGKSHLKHTEGGDFREAAIRALRQGLMKANCCILEPFVSFIIRCSISISGKITTDLVNEHCVIRGQENENSQSCIISGEGPLLSVEQLKKNYTLAGMTDILFQLLFSGFMPSPNSADIIQRAGYNPEQDLLFPCDSIFCIKGAGHSIKWNEADLWMHTEPYRDPLKPEFRTGNRGYRLSEAEFASILKKEFNSPEIQLYNSVPKTLPSSYYQTAEIKIPFYLIDGNNLLHLLSAEKSTQDTDLLKNTLLYELENWAEYCGYLVKIVFDGYGEDENVQIVSPGLAIQYSKNESADVVLERTAAAIGPSYLVTMVTSDKLIQISASASGVKRMSSREYLKQLEKGIALLRKNLADAIQDLKFGISDSIQS